MQTNSHIRHAGSPRCGAPRRLFLPALFLLLAALGGTASAADGTAQSDIEARYQQERAACNSGKSTEDQATCLREAAAARAAARQGELAEPQADYAKNAVARCQALPAADRDICQRRARGEGSTEGSVAGGGIIREYREIILPPAVPQEGIVTHGGANPPAAAHPPQAHPPAQQQK